MVASIYCPTCGAEARRQEVYPVHFTGFVTMPNSMKNTHPEPMAEAKYTLDKGYRASQDEAGRLEPRASNYRQALKHVEHLQKIGVKEAKEKS